MDDKMKMDSKMMTDDKTKMLKLMRFWLFGTFVIVYAAVTVYAGYFVGLEIMKQTGYWIIIGVTAVMCVAVYFVYVWWLNRKS
ncbi:MAG: hypothetical protein HY023_10945 [Chloroflexi bacterium]|nr:hypothetical protein [Chloroflexota bacterium]MBI3763738.1 hypothetical protein [Chloroflexota bacterium]